MMLTIIFQYYAFVDCHAICRWLLILRAMRHWCRRRTTLLWLPMPIILCRHYYHYYACHTCWLLRHIILIIIILIITLDDYIIWHLLFHAMIIDILRLRLLFFTDDYTISDYTWHLSRYYSFIIIIIIRATLLSLLLFYFSLWCQICHLRLYYKHDADTFFTMFTQISYYFSIDAHTQYYIRYFAVTFHTHIHYAIVYHILRHIIIVITITHHTIVIFIINITLIVSLLSFHFASIIFDYFDYCRLFHYRCHIHYY